MFFFLFELGAELFNHRRCQERDHDLMMSYEGEASAAFLGRALDHVRQRTVVGEEIHIGGGDVF